MIAVNEQVSETSFRKIRAHIQDAAICMVTTNVREWSLKQEAPHHQWMDNDGNIWLVLNQEEQEVSLNSYQRMEVFYSNVRQSQFLSLVGVARRCDQEHLSAIAYRSLPHNGPSRYIRFTPREAFYWDDRVKSMVPLPLPGKAAGDEG